MARKKEEKKSFDYNYEYDYDINDSEPKKKNTKKKSEEKKEEPQREEPKREAREEKREDEARTPNIFLAQLSAVFIFVIALFLTLCLIFAGSGKTSVVGVVGVFIGNFLLGVFGATAFCIPLILMFCALHMKRDVENGEVHVRVMSSIAALIFLSVIVHTFFCIISDSSKVVDSNALFNAGPFTEMLKKLFTSGADLVGGGFLGGILANSFIKVVGPTGSLIFSVLFLLIFLMYFFGATPASIWERAKFYIIRMEEKRAQRSEREKKAREARSKSAEAARSVPYSPPATITVKGTKRGPGNERAYEAKTFNPSDRKRKMSNIDAFSMTESTELDICDKEKYSRKETIRPEKHDVKMRTSANLQDIFNTSSDDIIKKSYDEKELSETKEICTTATLDVNIAPPTPPATIEKGAKAEDFVNVPALSGKNNEESLDVVRTNVIKRAAQAAQEPPKRDYVVFKDPEPEVVEEPKAPEYVFPPVELLNYKEPTNQGDVEQELSYNAAKLVETLDSFNIRTRVVNISRGPAVTRYEIAPEAGTKVSTIVNRVDDISLGLASQVLIEGVIPGKSAIGVQVPNKNKSIVYLRELIDSEDFQNSKSNLTCALGIDLTGAKIFFDLTRMPHLLVAGATNQGKSVCVNSLIVSLLYKSTPDDVKLILIDPKKVEFSDYNGLPHLIVPVVNDPKKAAGSLHWCVTEMERRYEILETTRQKKLSEYIEFQKQNPQYEKLSYIVVIIDELADLMTTAPDDVETSIARITAKGRAAGIHLIVSTQRPDTSVITGTIKSNIPSRIALKCSSQIDSRTVLDRAGAEKLVGKGDLLFSSADMSNMLRVQCAFVDKEVEKIVDFIKENNGGERYNKEIAEQIDKEAELCGKKGKASSSPVDDGDSEMEDDPMLEEAIKVAIDEKKISTSLIQRRLHLGYGRAAKLLDMMEARGIIGPLDGQKPREVLITYEEYLEKSMRSGD